MTMPFEGPVPELSATDGYGMTVGVRLKSQDGKPWAYCGSDVSKDEWEAYQRLWLSYAKQHRDIVRIRHLETMLDWMWAHVGMAFLVGIVLGGLMCKYVRG